ncbi:MAG: dihydrodipicolinate synthase family protein [Oceanospirillaceae bacterium]|nr:dihydrodipicolinate synthase family protein [Oceanospirillaceae bacterium]
MNFTGLSAFPLTPFYQDKVDEQSLQELIARLVNARVDSIGALGSTGCYTYLNRTERKRIIELSLQHCGNIPVIAGISAQRTRDVLELAEDVQKLGVQAVLLSPTSYQALSSEEVFSLYQSVTANISVPLCIYDNPGTTHFRFTDELYVRLAQLPNVTSIKIPGVPADLSIAKRRIEHLKAILPASVSLGVSGDGFGATGLNAGCNLWYSAIAGLYPKTMLAITRAAQANDAAQADKLNAALQPLWMLFGKYGSLRVIAACAELEGLVKGTCLPQPLMAIQGEDRDKLGLFLNHFSLQ